MESDRYFDGDNLKRWVGECFDYIEVDGIKIPSRVKATWKLERGDFTYVDFKVQEIEFNSIEQY